jgi:GTP-binding protein EngB required for normal cell division
VNRQGYESARLAGEAVVATVQDIATLIGEPKAEISLESGERVAPGLGLNEDAAALLARARDLGQGLFTIIVLGEFKNGKSTLLNAMLGSKTLPAKATPATAIITVLVGGEHSEVSVFETGRSEPRVVTGEQFLREFQLSLRDQETIQERGTLDRFANVEYAEMECNHALCAHGVRLIDSPGLGEHLSRTRVATNFLKRSQAVVMVLNATRILTRDERSFIEALLGEGRLAHVFFVVNRINQVDPAKVDEIRSWVESQLASHFQAHDGGFDSDFYHRRVFFVDALGALEARSTVPNDVEKLRATGVPAFEEEIESFLTGEDKVASTLQSTVQFLAPVVTAALDRIRQADSALEAPLEELEARRRESESSLLELAGKKRETERTINLFADTIKQKVFANLTSFVDQMAETWDEDSRRLMDLDQAVSLRNVVVAYAQPEARRRMAVAISEEVQRYLEAKFSAWSDNLPSVVEHDVKVLLREVEAQIEDLELELDRIAAAFAGTAGGRGDRTAGDRLFRVALSLGEIVEITDDVMDVGDLSAVVARLVQRSVVVHLVRMFVGVGALMANVLIEVLQGGFGEGEVKRRIRQTLGERLVAALREQVTERRDFVFKAIEERFQEFASTTTDVIGRRIDEVRAEQERILRQRRDEDFSAESERRRLSLIDAEVRRLNLKLATFASNI